MKLITKGDLAMKHYTPNEEEEEGGDTWQNRRKQMHSVLLIITYIYFSCVLFFISIVFMG